jgi:hypothetical protein
VSQVRRRREMRQIEDTPLLFRMLGALLALLTGKFVSFVHLT